MHESRLMGGMRRALVVAGAGFGVALLSAGVASAADPVQVRSRLGNWCLDGPNGRDTPAILNPCNGSKSQLWNFRPDGQIESLAFPKQCLGINNPADLTPVVLSPCRNDGNYGRWTTQPNGQITSSLGPCLNVNGGVANPATPVIAFQCNADLDEQWDSV
jgi:hypothetical protein